DDVLGGGRRAGLRKRSCDGRRLRGFGGPLFLRPGRRDAFDGGRLVGRPSFLWVNSRRSWLLLRDVRLRSRRRSDLRGRGFELGIEAFESFFHPLNAKFEAAKIFG